MPEIWFPNLDIEVMHFNRIAFTIFGINIYWYGIFIATGLILGLLVTLNEAKRTNQDQNFYIDLVIVGAIVSIICARIYYVAFSWDYYRNHLSEILAIRNGGIAIYGAIIGAIITAFIYCKIKKKKFLKVTDTFSFAFVIGQIIGRWGNFANREAFGGYTDSLFAMRYLKEQVANIPKDVLDKVVNINGTEYIQVHPTFLYESLWNVGVLIILFIIRKRKRFDGQLTATYFIVYGIGRFWIEGLRTDSLMIGNTGLRVSQVLSLLLVIGFSIFMIKKFRETKIFDVEKYLKLNK